MRDGPFDRDKMIPPPRLLADLTNRLGTAREETPVTALGVLSSFAEKTKPKETNHLPLRWRVVFVRNILGFHLENV